VTSKFAKKSTSSDLNETWYDVRGRWDIHDDMTFKVIRGQGQGEKMTSVPYQDYFYLMPWPQSIGVIVLWRFADWKCLCAIAPEIRGPFFRKMAMPPKFGDCFCKIAMPPNMYSSVVCVVVRGGGRVWGGGLPPPQNIVINILSLSPPNTPFYSRSRY